MLRDPLAPGREQVPEGALPQGPRISTVKEAKRRRGHTCTAVTTSLEGAELCPHLNVVCYLLTPLPLLMYSRCLGKASGTVSGSELQGTKCSPCLEDLLWRVFMGGVAGEQAGRGLKG